METTQTVYRVGDGFGGYYQYNTARDAYRKASQLARLNRRIGFEPVAEMTRVFDGMVNSDQPISRAYRAN